MLKEIALTMILGAPLPDFKLEDTIAKNAANLKLVKSAYQAAPQDISDALSQGADINIQTEFGDTALHLAIAKGTPEIINLLLEHGAEPELPNQAGYTPIEIARRHKKDDILLLLENYPDAAKQAIKAPSEELLLKSIQLGWPAMASYLLKHKELPIAKENLKQYLELAQIYYDKTKNPSYKQIAALIKGKLKNPLLDLSNRRKSKRMSRAQSHK